MTRKGAASIRTSSVDLLDAINLCHRLAGDGPHPTVSLLVVGEQILCRGIHGSAGIEVRVEVSGAAHSKGPHFVDSKTLQRGLKGCAKGTVEVTFDDTGYVLLTDETGFSVTLLAAEADDDFPQWPTPVGSKQRIPAGVGFGDILRRVATHASTNVGRINICAIYFEHDGKYGYVCATDGHRLAVVAREFKWPELKGITISPNLVDFIPPSDQLSVTVDKELVFFETTRQSVWGRRGGSTFPPFRSVIPAMDGQTPMLCVDAKAFFATAGAFDRIREGTTGVELSAAKGLLQLRTHGAPEDRPIGFRQLAAEGKRPSKETVVVDGSFLHQAQKILQEEKLRFYWSGPLDPLVVLDGYAKYTLIVMMPRRC